MEITVILPLSTLLKTFEIDFLYIKSPGVYSLIYSVEDITEYGYNQ